MTQTFRNRSPFGATATYDYDLGTTVIRLGQIPGWEQKAEHLQSASSTVVFDDPNGTVGHAGDAILGQSALYVTESDCPVGFRNIYYGIVGPRQYARGDSSRASLRTGVSRQITVELYDLNALPSLRVIPQSDRTAIRPRETVDDRIAWIMGTTYMTIISDLGLIASNTNFCSKADYRGQRAVNVINDCEIAAGFGWNAFVYYDGALADAGLFFDNANTSTAYTSTLRLSNVLADKSSTTLMVKDLVLKRDPTNLGDTVYMPFRNGFVYRSRTATTAIYGQKDLIAPNSNVKKRSVAWNIAGDILSQSRNEEDRITCSVDIPTTQVGLIKAGHRIPVKGSHLPGYTDFTWCRVLNCAPGQALETDSFYTMALELSPQEDFPASLLQCKSTFSAAETTVTLDSNPVVGNLLISRLITRNSDVIPEMFDSSWTLFGSGAARNNYGAIPRGAVAVYAKIADSTNPIIGREATASQMQMTVCEISGRGLDDITAFSADHATGGAWNPGSGSGTIGLTIIAVPRGDDSHGNGYDISPASGWVVEKNCDIDNGVACAFAPPDPWWWAAKVTNQTTVDLAVTIAPHMCGTLNILREWCAVAIFV